MLANRFRRPVARNPLGAGVPGPDHAIRIQEIDGVVGDGVDQQLKAVGGRQVLYGTGKLEFHLLTSPSGGCFIVSKSVAIVNRRALRSEERRVGKECRSSWSPYQ